METSIGSKLEFEENVLTFWLPIENRFYRDLNCPNFFMWVVIELTKIEYAMFLPSLLLFRNFVSFHYWQWTKLT